MKKATFLLTLFLLTPLQAIVDETLSATNLPFGDPTVPVSADITALDPVAKANQDFLHCTGPQGLSCQMHPAPEKCAAACSKAIQNATGIAVLPPNFGQPVQNPNDDLNQLIMMMMIMSGKESELDIPAPAQEPEVAQASEPEEKGKGKKKDKKKGK